MSVTCQFNGRWGNVLFNMSQVIAYCAKHNLQYYFPTYAWACTGGVVPWYVLNTGQQPVNPTIYTEPQDTEGHPYYHEIPAMDNVEFRGYYQAWKYFEDHRDTILRVINLPWSLNEGVVGIHIRRGDCVAQPDGFPMAPIEYYKAAIDYMIQKGYDNFRVFSDDMPWCRGEFTISRYPGANFMFTEGGTDVGDFIELSSCAHQVTARSTFSLMAGWFNQNPNKLVLCPSIEQHYWWRGQNRDLLNTSFLTQINW